MLLEDKFSREPDLRCAVEGKKVCGKSDRKQLVAFFAGDNRESSWRTGGRGCRSNCPPIEFGLLYKSVERAARVSDHRVFFYTRCILRRASSLQTSRVVFLARLFRLANCKEKLFFSPCRYKRNKLPINFEKSAATYILATNL